MTGYFLYYMVALPSNASDATKWRAWNLFAHLLNVEPAYEHRRRLPVRGAGRVSATERAHVIIDPRDNVATVLDQGTSLRRLEGGLEIGAGVPFGHKIALRAIPQGEPVIKYGVAIGRATCDITAGEHVHVHNCA